MKQLPSLNGLRAVSIGLVISSHAIGRFETLKPWMSYLFMFDGALGVRIFFCISGFLITYPLLAEQKANTASLRLFYLRRALRIMPVSYAFVAAMIALAALNIASYPPCQILTALTYTKNYACGAALDGHLWSLSVEEQFYLIWPWIVLYCRPRTALSLALTFIAVSPFSRAAEYLVGHRAFFWLPSHTDALWQARYSHLLQFSIGKHQKNSSLARKIYATCNNFSTLTALFLWIPIALWQIHSDNRAKPSIQAICATYLIASFAFQRSGFGFQLLNLTVISYIGILSYSRDIWQEPFLFAFPFPAPIGLLLTFAVAACSYHFLENRF